MCFQHHKTHTVEKQCSLITTVSTTFITMRAIQEWHSNHNLPCKTRNKTYGEKMFDCKVSVTTNKVTYTINVLLFRKLKYEMNLRFFFLLLQNTINIFYPRSQFINVNVLKHDTLCNVPSFWLSHNVRCEVDKLFRKRPYCGLLH